MNPSSPRRRGEGIVEEFFGNYESISNNHKLIKAPARWLGSGLTVGCRSTPWASLLAYRLA